MKLTAVVDLDSERAGVERALHTHGYGDSHVTKIFIKPEQNQAFAIPEELEQHCLTNSRISGVIISTEPLRHLDYSRWALRKGFNILLDKPISTYENVATDETQAGRFIPDFESLLKEYRLAQKERGVRCFSLMAQRRYHSSYRLMASAIREIFEKTNCPVTSINTVHNDGQWRTPNEMLTQLYHSYYQGYGKASHSGYHYFDIIPFLLSAGVSEEKSYDELETSAVFVRPTDFLAQLNLKDHSQILPQKEFWQHHQQTEIEYARDLSSCGEMDLSAQIELKKSNRCLTHISLFLGHNGVSQRNWAHPEGRDLYKGIGRIAHETHLIQQGPFQSIQFHSYKSKDNPMGKDAYGGEQHLEVVIYRNNRIFGGQHVERYQLKDFTSLETGFRPISSPAKMKCFQDFLDTAAGLNVSSLSDLESQRPAVDLTHSIYLSAVRVA
jgi:predicted dehydrogenase